jgi:hypothetical protein
MKVINMLLAAVVLSVVLTGCSAPEAQDDAKPSAAEDVPIDETTAAPPQPESPTDDPASSLAPKHEVELVAKVLRGECYDDEPDDKREVARVICNRVSASGFGDSIEAVITAPMQFVGYRPENEPSENDYAIAREVLGEWYAGGREPLSEYLFFSSGEGDRNAFRKQY